MVRISISPPFMKDKFMNKIAALSLALFFSLAIAESALADDNTYQYAGEFLSLGMGARALAMGGAFVAVADDSSATYWNPAGLALMQKGEGAFMHAYTFKGLVKVDTLSIAYPISKKYGTISGGMLRVGVDDIKETGWTDPNDPNRRPEIKSTFNWADTGYYISYARQLLSRIYIGFSTKIIRQGGGDWGGSGYGFDVGIMTNPLKNLNLAVNFQDIYSRVKWDTGAIDRFPVNAKVGLAYTFSLPSIESKLVTAFDSDIKKKGYDYSAQLSAGSFSFDLHYGAEFIYRNTLAIRAGAYRSNFAAGAGLRFKMFTVDYAFQTHTDLGGSHRISAGVVF